MQDTYLTSVQSAVAFFAWIMPHMFVLPQPDLILKTRPDLILKTRPDLIFKYKVR
jgi:hypothetical protein